MKYKVYCETDEKWEEFDCLMPREECPVDSNHVIRAGSLSGVGDSTEDYKVLRNKVIIRVATEGFSNLTAQEKEIASENFCVSKADRDSVHTIDEQVAFGIEYHKKSTIARSKRRKSIEAEVYNRIQSAVERADLMSDAAAMIDAYVDFGVEGSLEGDGVGIFDYLESRVGTPFENTGLLSKTYTIEGMTVSEFSARLIDVLKNGNY
jgi:hypothetical protein